MTPRRGILYWIERSSLNLYRKNFIHKQLGKCFWGVIGFGVGPEGDVSCQPQRMPVFEQNKAIWIIAGCFLLCQKCFISMFLNFSLFFLLWFCVRKSFSTLINFFNSLILEDSLWFYFPCLNMLCIQRKSLRYESTVSFSHSYPNVTVCSIVFNFPVDLKCNLYHVWIRDDFKRWDILENICTAVNLPVEREKLTLQERRYNYKSWTLEKERRDGSMA